jgi:acyl-CoA thioesterase FadM
VVASIVDVGVGNTSLTVSCQMSQEGKLTVQGKAVLVYMDTKTKSPRRIPDILREKIADL